MAYNFLELKLSSRSPGGHGKTVIVNVLVAELKTCLRKETLPADPFDPFADPLVAAGTPGVSLDDRLDRLNRGGPSGRLVGNEGHSQLGEHRRRFHVGDLAANPNGDPVALAVCQGQSGTHGVAVTAEHTAVVVDLDTFQLAYLFGLDCSRRACGNYQRNFTHVLDAIILDEGRLPVNAQNCYIRAVNGAAHVKTARQGDANLRGQLVAAEILEQLVHNGLNDTGGIDGRGMAVCPTLGVDDIGDAASGPAYREPVAAGAQLGQKRLELCLIAHQELDVVSGCPAQVSAAELIGQIAQLEDIIGADQTRRTNANLVHFGSRFGHVNQDARLKNFVVFHLPKFSLITGGKNLSYLGGPMSVIRSFIRLFGSKAIFCTS